MRIVSVADEPELRERLGRFEAFAEFMHHDATCNRLWPRLFERYPEFQFALVDDERVVAEGNSVPTRWTGPDPRGVDGVLVRSFELEEHPTALSALQIRVAPDRRGGGLSATMISHMRKLASEHELGFVVAPVRPSWKERYPLTPIGRYVTWTREDGLPFDPWMRVHARLGAETVAVAPESMSVEASVGQWEDWTQMRFPESGKYIVPGALVPVDVDCARDLGRYVEPNVWMRHASIDAPLTR